MLWCRLSECATRREAERKAVETLLRHAIPEGFRLLHTPDGAPLLADSPLRVSVSHSRTHAAIALCADATVGIDIETPRRQLQRVAPRVLSADELQSYSNDHAAAWTLKEALYKAALTPGLDFRRDIRLPLGDKKNEATIVLPDGNTMRFDILYSGPLADGTAALVRAHSLVP